MYDRRIFIGILPDALDRSQVSHARQGDHRVYTVHQLYHLWATMRTTRVPRPVASCEYMKECAVVRAPWTESANGSVVLSAGFL